ncbi:hypothetical protein LA5095_03351 [Roseibium album]|uniref:Uncharacterized protein n=1 Tax=Roseibium album TaxID=311410 RepID=A0A0M6ZAS4_9HYPH|nr:hypothetical protein LA5094_02294 [Roseibium album]CTQ65309.1 hypothetical protein LA5096_00717 [Roseibium album]CTQ75240.1 hypothetical protein LA5095_03351 [Roseibium album]
MELLANRSDKLEDSGLSGLSGLRTAAVRRNVSEGL